MYDYQAMKPEIFTEEGQELFLKIRDNVQTLLKISGAFDMDHATRSLGGNSWAMLACVDRLVELGEIKEIPTNGFAQYRVFVKAD